MTTSLDPAVITDYHAHVYFAPEARARAEALRAAVAERYPAARLGRVWDKPIGPHPCPSYQIAFPPALFAELVPFLALNRDGLDVLVHPNTGDDLSDHRDRALWLGQSHPLDLTVL